MARELRNGDLFFLFEAHFLFVGGPDFREACLIDPSFGQDIDQPKGDRMLDFDFEDRLFLP